MKAALPFERGPRQLAERVRGLRDLQANTAVDQRPDIGELQRTVKSTWQAVYGGLTPWQVVQVARHPQRRHTLDCIDALCTDFIELRGDRAGYDDAILAGRTRFEFRPLVVMGHQRCRNTKERTRRNFGTTRPEGYRMSMRLMQLTEQFGLPLVTFINPPDAFSGVEAKERGQSAAVGQGLLRVSQLTLPAVWLVKEIVAESTAGAHRDPAKAAEYVGRMLRASLDWLHAMPRARCMHARQRRLRKVGALQELIA